jgi:hypothetical protein
LREDDLTTGLEEGEHGLIPVVTNTPPVFALYEADRSV